MVELIDNRTHSVIKRDGSIEPYSYDKLYRVILWACDDSEPFAKQLMEAISIKINLH